MLKKKTEEKIRVIYLPLLNQRSAEAVLNQYIGNGDKYKYDAHHTVLFRREQARQYDGNQELDTLGASIFH